MTITTWAKANAKMSVCVNGAFLPFTSAPDAMQRYVRPALFSTGDEGFELQKFGTAFMAKYRNWSFGLMTHHQGSGLNGAPSAENFVVVADAGERKLAVPPSALHKPRVDSADDRNLEDLIILDYSRASHPQPHIDLSSVLWSDAQAVSTDYSFLVGFPTDSMIIEIDSEEPYPLTRFTARWVRQDLEWGEPALMDPEHRDIFVKHPKSTRLSIDPDGLSGSPVFSIVSNGLSERQLRFDGLITHAKDDRFAVYPSSYMRPILDSIVDEMI